VPERKETVTWLIWAQEPRFSSQPQSMIWSLRGSEIARAAPT
jgi:hypothetical protein